MLLEYIIWTFVLYWLFRFVFNFLVPVFRVTKQMKEQVRNFQNTTAGQHYQQSSSASSYQQSAAQSVNQNSSSTKAPQPKADDYIDFEEIK